METEQSVLPPHAAINNSPLLPTVYFVPPQDSGRDGTHLPGHDSPGDGTHRGGWHLPLGVNQRGPKLPPEGHLWGRVSAMGNSGAASQGQCHAPDASLRWAVIFCVTRVFHAVQCVNISLSFLTISFSSTNVWWTSTHAVLSRVMYFQRNKSVRPRKSEADKLILAVTLMQAHATKTHLPKCIFYLFVAFSVM